MDMSDNAIFFLGYFLGASVKHGAYGPTPQEWRELVETACASAPHLGKPKWLRELEKGESRVAARPPTDHRTAAHLDDEIQF